MEARTTVEIEGETYALAFPIGAFEEVAQINPYMRRVVADLQGEDCNYKLARQISEIALRYGGGPATVEFVYDRHGWGVFQEMALSALVCGFAEENTAGNAGAAAKRSATKRSK